MAAAGSAVDGMPAGAALAALAPLFEGAPRFLARLVAARPLGTWDRLFERARRIAQDMPEAEQVELIDAHPRLGASAAAMSPLSAREQGGSSGTSRRDDGANPPTLSTSTRPATPATLATLARLNEAYEGRFGFRYCVFVAGRPLRALIPDFEAALAADRDSELQRGLDAVIDIARARHVAAAGGAGGAGGTRRRGGGPSTGGAVTRHEAAERRETGR